MKLPAALCELRRRLQMWTRGTRIRSHYKLNKRFIRYFQKNPITVLSMNSAELECFYVQHFYGQAGEHIK